MLLRSIILFLFISYSQLSFANENMFHIDIDYIMNNSIAGKSIITQLDNINKKNLSELKKIEDDLKKEEKKNNFPKKYS
jgi:Skp family chaperone for outer membrane proteins